MSSPWKINTEPVQTMNFAEIMSEEYAHRVQDDEIKRYERIKSKEDEDLQKVLRDFGEMPNFSQILTSVNEGAVGNDIPSEILAALQKDVGNETCDSDELLAQMLQSQFDHEYNEELKRIEKQQNKQSKVQVTLDKFRRNGDMEFMHASDDSYEEDEEDQNKRDWDRFETNEKIMETIPKCGFKINKEGEMITKHDDNLCGVRNACRVMSFPPEFATGDGAGFDMKLSNKVFNQLRTHSRRSGSNSGSSKRNRMLDRKEQFATAEMGVDGRTSMILYKLINNQILEQINGIISTGKEAVILHGNCDSSYSGAPLHGNQRNSILIPPKLLPKECAIKIFKTTLNEFKQRDRYIKDDYRFKDRFSKQNNTVIINMWAEKEMHNLMRMQSVGINCPDVIVLKKHVLIMSFIGNNHIAAPKLKDAVVNFSELVCAYNEIIDAMHKLYNEAKLVHADLSEYNILWYDGKCWFIDVAQSVEREHPSALEFLMRDCTNIINFFTKRNVPDIFTKEQLFENITSLNAEQHNVAMLERIHTKGASITQATAPEQESCPDEFKLLEYPFDAAWAKSQADRKTQSSVDSNDAANDKIQNRTDGI